MRYAVLAVAFLMMTVAWSTGLAGTPTDADALGASLPTLGTVADADQAPVGSADNPVFLTDDLKVWMAAPKDAALPLILEFPTGADVSKQIAALEAVGGVLENHLTEGLNHVYLTLPTDQLANLVDVPDLLVAYRDYPRQTFMNQITSNTFMGHDAAQSAGFDGTGIMGEVQDNGIDQSHPDLGNLAFTDGTVAQDSHGTCTFGIIFADGTNDMQAQGILYNGIGVFADWSTGRTTSIANLWRGQFNEGSAGQPGFFQSNSWSQGALDGTYTAFTSEDDQAAWDNNHVLSLWALGNSNSGTAKGLITQDSSLKNGIGVGAFFHGDTASRADDNFNTACGAGCTPSRGPAADGRVKPDLAAPFDWIYTTDQVGAAGYVAGDYYDDFGGTSGATPITAGSAGQVYSMYIGNFFGNNPGGAYPQSSMVKAILIADAYQYPLATLDRDTQGWGVVDMEYTTTLGPDYHVLADRPMEMNGGDVWSRMAYVDGTQDLKATLTWIDPAAPGTTGSGRALLNNFDLRVIGPGGEEWWGNLGMNLNEWTTPYTGSEVNDWTLGGDQRDDLNNVENVWVQTPTSGVYIFEVYARAGDFAQQGNFSLAIGGASDVGPFGVLSFDQSLYAGDDLVTISLADTDLDTNSAAVEVYPLTITSDTEPSGELVILTETAINSGVFEGSLTISTVNAPSILQVSDGDLIYGDYFDADNGTGPSWYNTTALIDAAFPIVSNVLAMPSFDSVTITFNTNEPTDAGIYFDLPPTPSTWYPSLASMATNHTVVIGGLPGSTAFLFDVEATDVVGQTTLDDNSGPHYPTATTGIPDIWWSPLQINITAATNSTANATLTLGNSGLGPIYHNLTPVPFPPGAVVFTDDVEGGDLGYTPSAGFAIRSLNANSPINAWNFGNGMYANNTIETLISPPVDLTGIPAANLTIWHQMDAESCWDGGNLKISTTGAGGPWNLITPEAGYTGILNAANPAIGGEAGWCTEVLTFSQDIFVIDAYSGGMVWFLWTWGSDGSVIGSGWNIDDIEVTTGGGGVLPWLSLNPDFGTIPAGQTRPINAVVDTTNMAMGLYQGYIETASNDPDEGLEYIPVNLNVVAAAVDTGVTAVAVADPATYGPMIPITATVANTGLNPVPAVVTDLYINGVPENSSTTVPLGVGASDNLMWLWSPPTPGIYTIEVYGNPVAGETGLGNNWFNTSTNVVAYPDIWVDPASFAVTLPTNASTSRPLTIGNSAFGELYYNITLDASGGQMFFDDVEGGDLGYTLSAQWGIRALQANSPSNSWNVGNAGYGDLWDESLVSPPIDLTSATDANLTFWHWADFEGTTSNYDGGNLAISTTGPGGPWTAITPVGGYDAAISGSFSSPIANEQAYCYDRLTFEQATFVLDAYIGQTLNIRWRFASDSSASGYPGWNIDDIEVTGSSSGSPFVTVIPATGMVPQFSSNIETVWFDSTNLSVGLYYQNLTIGSNDPDEPAVVVPATLNVVSAQYDVTPTSITPGPSVPIGSQATVDTTIENLGLQPIINIQVNLTVNGTLVNQTLIPAIASGASVPLTFGWTTTQVGLRSLMVRATPFPGENITTNNEISAPYTVNLIPDTTAPVAANQYPAPGGVSTNLTPTISVELSDPILPLTLTSLVDQATIDLQIDNVSVAAIVTGIPGGFLVEFTSGPLVFGQVVFVRIIADDNSGNTHDSSWVFTASTTYDMPVQMGWNLLGVPIIAAGEPAMGFLDDSGGDGATAWDLLWVWDGAGWDSIATYRPAFMNDPIQLYSATGMWMNISAIGDGFLTLQGGSLTTQTVNLATGWNLVGFPRQTPTAVTTAMAGITYTNLIGSDGFSAYLMRDYVGADVMQPAAGYWIEVASAQVWDP